MCLIKDMINLDARINFLNENSFLQYLKDDY